MIDRPDCKVLLADRYEGAPLSASGRLILEPGAPIWWFVFPGAWHDVGRLHLADGRFTGWYTNLCTPIDAIGTDWSATDLFLDHWLPVEGEPEWLDTDEFEAAAIQGTIGEAEVRQARREQVRIQSLVDRGAWPPPATREPPDEVGGVPA